MQNIFNLTEELKKMIGSQSPDIIDPLAASLHPWAWRMRLKFDTKSNARELFTEDIRFHNPQWGDSDQFKDPILSMEFYLPIKYKICMVGMELYNFYIEVIGDLTGQGKTRIESFWFTGKLPRTTVVKSWNVGKGKVITDDAVFGKEYNGTASKGWRTGTPSQHPISTLMRID